MWVFMYIADHHLGIMSCDMCMKLAARKVKMSEKMWNLMCFKLHYFNIFKF